MQCLRLGTGDEPRAREHPDPLPSARSRSAPGQAPSRANDHPTLDARRSRGLERLGVSRTDLVISPHVNYQPAAITTHEVIRRVPPRRPSCTQISQNGWGQAQPVPGS